jgi:site-specific DNA recombinase
MRAVVYARLSTDLQSESSIEEQLRRCKQYCEMKGYEFIADFTDIGTGMNTERAGFKEMMERIDEWDIAIAYKLDRFHRSSSNAQSWATKLNEVGKNFAALDIDIDTSSAFGMAIFKILTALNEMEVQVTKERTVMGLIGVKNDGRWVGKPPYGYGSVYSRTKDEGDKGLLEFVPEEVDVVRIIFQQQAMGKTNAEIADFLIENGITTKSGKRSWAQATIAGIIKNKEFYEGKYYDSNNDQMRYTWQPILEVEI